MFKEFCSNYRTERAKETDSYLVATHREKKKYIGLNHPSSTFEDSCFLSYASCICWEIRKRIYEIILISLSSNRWQLSWKRVLLITDLNTRWPSRTLLIFIDTFQFNRKFQFPCFFLFLTKIGELISRTIFINFFSRRFINIFLIFKFSLTKYSLYYSLLYKGCKCL